MEAPFPNSAAEAIEDLRLIGLRVDQATDIEQLRPLFYRQDAIARKFPEDPSVQFLSAALKQRISEIGQQLRQGSAPPSPPPSPSSPAAAPPAIPVYPSAHQTVRLPPPPAFSRTEAVPEPERQSPAPAPAVPPPPPPPPPVTVRPTRLASAPPPKTSSSPPVKGILAGLAALVVAGGVIAGVYFWPRPKPAPVVKTFDITVVTTPQGAELRVDRELRGTSNTRIPLAAGKHILEAVLPGYEPGVVHFEVGPDRPADVALTLQAVASTLRFATDFANGTVAVDGGEARPLQQGQIELSDVKPGVHTIVIAEGKRTVTYQVQVDPGRPPTVIGAVDAKDALAVMISAAGREAMVRSSVPLPVQVDGKPAGETGAEPLALKDLEPGDRELTLGAGIRTVKRVANFGANPVLTTFVILEVNAGGLLVVAGVDGARVTINGKPQTRLTAKGQLRISQLAPGDYEIGVSKEGFEAIAPQRATIRKGEDTRVAFTLRAAPKMATLAIAGATPGTAVLVDGQSTGETGPDGSLVISGVPPGMHTIEMRKDRHEARMISRNFTAGATVEISGAEAALQRLPAVVRLRVTPPDAAVTVKGPTDSAARVVRPPQIALAEGTYTFSAYAPGYTPLTVSQRVAGEPVEVVLSLNRIVEQKKAAPPPPKVVASGMDAFEDAQGWSQAEGWYERKGGGLVALRQSPVKGTVSFTVMLLKGKRAQWAVKFADAKNYLLFQMDKSNFSRREVVNGKNRELFKAKHNAAGKEGMTVAIEIAPSTLIHRVLVGGAWQVVDTWENPNTDFTQGRFGLLIPDDDRWRIANFSFHP